MADLNLDLISSECVSLERQISQRLLAYLEKKKNPLKMDPVGFKSGEKLHVLSLWRTRGPAASIVFNHSTIFSSTGRLSPDASTGIPSTQSAPQLDDGSTYFAPSCGNFHRIESLYYLPSIMNDEGNVQDLLGSDSFFKLCRESFMEKLVKLRTTYQSLLKTAAIDSFENAERIFTTPSLACLLVNADIGEILLHHLNQDTLPLENKKRLLLSVINNHTERLNTSLYDLLQNAAKKIDLDEPKIADAIAAQYITLIRKLNDRNKNFIFPPAYRYPEMLQEQLFFLSIKNENLRNKIIDHPYFLSALTDRQIRRLAAIHPQLSKKIFKARLPASTTSESSSLETEEKDPFQKWKEEYLIKLHATLINLKRQLEHNFRSLPMIGMPYGSMTLSYPYDIAYDESKKKFIPAHSLFVSQDTKNLIQDLNALRALLPAEAKQRATESETTESYAHLSTFPMGDVIALLEKIAAQHNPAISPSRPINVFLTKFNTETEIEKNHTLFYFFALESPALFSSAPKVIKDLLSLEEQKHIQLMHDIGRIGCVEQLSTLLDQYRQTFTKSEPLSLESLISRRNLLETLRTQKLDEFCEYLIKPTLTQARRFFTQQVFSREESAALDTAAKQGKEALNAELQKLSSLDTFDTQLKAMPDIQIHLPRKKRKEIRLK